MSFLTKFRLFKRGAGWLFTGNIGFFRDDSVPQPAPRSARGDEGSRQFGC